MLGPRSWGRARRRPAAARWGRYRSRVRPEALGCALDAGTPPTPEVVVGYNPYRKQVRRRSDLVFVAAAFVAVAAALAWAAFGG